MNKFNFNSFKYMLREKTKSKEITMSEEKNIQTTQCKCFCKSEGFRNFVVVTLGTFAGVYMALSLFSAIHKPPMPCPCHFMHHMQMYGHHNPYFDYPSINKKFYKEFKKEVNKITTPKAED